MAQPSCKFLRTRFCWRYNRPIQRVVPRAKQTAFSSQASRFNSSLSLVPRQGCTQSCYGLSRHSMSPWRSLPFVTAQHSGDASKVKTTTACAMRRDLPSESLVGRIAILTTLAGNETIGGHAFRQAARAHCVRPLGWFTTACSTAESTRCFDSRKRGYGSNPTLQGLCT